MAAFVPTNVYVCSLTISVPNISAVPETSFAGKHALETSYLDFESCLEINLKPELFISLKDVLMGFISELVGVNIPEQSWRQYPFVPVPRHWLRRQPIPSKSFAANFGFNCGNSSKSRLYLIPMDKVTSYQTRKAIDHEQ
jgi:hypothetical protein